MFTLFSNKEVKNMESKFHDPAIDFSNGLLALKAYHEDFLKRGEKLLGLVEQIRQQGMTEKLLQQCVAMLCHYSHANQLHHQDEEQALFPLLVGQSALIDGMIERLMLDHEEIEASWEKLAALLKKPEQITDFEQFQQLTQKFERLQREHLNREDEDFSPKVKEILSSEQVQQVGLKMAALRGL